MNTLDEETDAGHCNQARKSNEKGIEDKDVILTIIRLELNRVILCQQ